ncbi:hypothetical protein GCM10022381_03510 [Leifsonia kafniensis]|uniref:LPXTG cell wall anchor domain-containing protein n=1 Tax=Leifsonia kafniensis TaxID=475957 RepID=A0ABP7K364_9MICO
MDRRVTKLFSSIAVVGLGIMAAGLVAQPAAANTAPASGCIAACTATFDTTGAGQAFTIPVGISALSATIAGSAGAPASFAITNDPTAVGGAGGVASVDLGTSYAGSTLTFGIGATGAGTYLQGSDAALLAVAGGGGGGGYAAYFQWADQILGTYPGGDGAAPASPGITAGSDGQAFGTLAANGAGGTAAGGQAGSGDSTGSTNGSLTTLIAGVPTLGTGGTGGTLDFAPTSITHTAGNGGGGYTGGGGGAVQRNVPGGDVDVDVVAPGGGGSAFLAAALTATAQAPNTGGGYVSFTWDYSPTIENTLPGTTPGTAPVVKRGATIPVRVAGLPAATAFSVVFDGVVVASGTTDSSGTAITSFTISSTQVAGTFAFELRVGTTTVAVSAPIVVDVSKPVPPVIPDPEGPVVTDPDPDPETPVVTDPEGPVVTDPDPEVPVVTDPETGGPTVTVPETESPEKPIVTAASLASTGTAFVGTLAIAAIVLLGGGAAIFFVARRRRRIAEESDTGTSRAGDSNGIESNTDKS